jgi:hypothetical protein
MAIKKKNPVKYDTIEEMNECRKKAEIAVKKLYDELGFVVYEVAKDIREGLFGLSMSERSIRNKRGRMMGCRCTRGGSSY